MVTSILLIILFVSVLGVVIIVGRKLSVLARLEVKNLPQERESDLKKQLLQKRIVRKLLFLARLRPVARAGARRLLSFFQRAVQFLSAKERFYHLTKLRRQQSPEHRQITTLSALDEIRSRIDAGEYDEAEQQLIEIITLEPKNVAAYRVLGELSMEKQDYDAARETYEHILKIEPENASAHFSLGRIAELTQEDNAGLEHFQNAAEVSKGNPKYIDKVTEIAILLKKKGIAKKAYGQLKKANPENEKLPELKKKIDEL